MSLYNDASLAMIPSAVKDGKLYSIRPSDGSGDFTFSRGSNLAATRVDVNGLIEKGRENLLLQSNQFDTTWATLNASVTSGQSGYDGTNDAWAFTDNNATNIHSLAQYGKWTSSVCTGSIYVKAGSLSKFYVSNGSSGIGVFFNLSNGSVEGVTGAVIAQSITSVGGDWYRLSVTIQSAGTFLIGAYQTFVSGNYNASINYTGTGTGTIYIQDAQLEVGLVATDYIETTTTTAVSGITEDLPRLDYSGGASCPSLLLEPQRTNLVTHSEYFDAWTKIGSPTITTNYGASPEGVQNSTRIQAVSGNRIYLSIGGSSSTYTYSIYAKGSGTFRLRDNSGTYSLNISPTSEWARYDYSFTDAFTNIQIEFTATSDVEIYGVQIEQGSYPTSYIPTYGTSQTRVAEDVSLTSAAVATIAPISGITMFMDFDLSQNQQTARFVAFNDAYSDYIFLGTQDTASNQSVRCDVRGGGVTFLSYNPTFTNVGRHKMAVKFLTSGIKIYLDGVEVASSGANAGFSEAFQKIVIGRDYPPVAGAFAASNTNSLIIFPTALTDSECIALTTL